MSYAQQRIRFRPATIRMLQAPTLTRISIVFLLGVGIVVAVLFSIPGVNAWIAINDTSSRQTSFEQLLSSVPYQNSDVEAFVSDTLIIEFTDTQKHEAILSKLNNDFVLRGLTGIATLDNVSSKYTVTEFSALFKARHKKQKREGTRFDPLTPFYIVNISGDALLAKKDFNKITGVKAQLVYQYTSDRVPDDTEYLRQYSHQITEAEAGWDIETGDERVTIAIIGTGVDVTHPDLSDNIWVNEGEVLDNEEDDDQNNYINDINGWDFENNDNDPSPQSSHETQVAGIAAAVTDNDEGVSGVTWHSKIMPLRIGFTTVDVANAIDYARENEARVINMSFGNYSINRYGPDTAVERAVNEAYEAGVFLVATAGNNSISDKRYPAALQNVMAVASTNVDDQRSEFSNFGPWVNVSAPGSSVYTTTLGGYSSAFGTSFSAPYVSGLAALLFSKNINALESTPLTPRDVWLRIEYSADKLNTDHFIGSGRVNVRRALELDENPSLFAIIKNPENNDFFHDESQEIMGTALGDEYLLEIKNTESEEGWTKIGSGKRIIDGVLGSIQPRFLDRGSYNIRLTVFFGEEIDQDEIRIFVERMNPDWLWPHENIGAMVSSPTFADIDNDGDFEIFIGTNSAGLYGWHHDGELLDGFPVLPPLGIFLFGSPAIANIDDDGAMEIVQGAHTPQGHVFRLKADGSFNNIILFAEGRIRPPIVLADLDGDGFDDIIAISSGSANPLNYDPAKIHAWNADGIPILNWPVEIEPGAQSAPVVGDIDGDYDLEIIVHQRNWLYAFRHDGMPVQGRFPIPLFSGYTSPALADLDGNGTIEIITATENEIKIFNGDGSLYAERLFSDARFTWSHFCLGDVDGDDFVEIFLGDENGNIYGLNHLGESLSRFPVHAEGRVGGCVIGDIDGNGGQEIIAGTSQGILYAWNNLGELLEDWPKGVGGAIWGAPAIGDLDNDGDIEVMVGTQEGSFFVFDLEDDANMEKQDWPMLQYNSRHTGLLHDGVMPVDTRPFFYRGNVDANNEINVGDIIYLLQALFEGGPQPDCKDSADVNDDGFIGVDDVVRLVLYLSGQVELDAPGIIFGSDPTEDNLGCEIPQQATTDDTIPVNAEVNEEQCDVFENLGLNAFEQQCAEFDDKDQPFIHDNFIRGDANQDGSVDGVDIQVMYNALQKVSFAQKLFSTCEKSFDVDDNGIFTSEDPGYLLDYLFLGTRLQPNAPFLNEGQDKTLDGLTCNDFSVNTSSSNP